LSPGTFAYCLSKCPPFRHEVLKELLPEVKVSPANTAVRIQRNRGQRGITDVEIQVDQEAHIIFEAKVGQAIPSTTQLAKYAQVCLASGVRTPILVGLTSLEIAPEQVPKEYQSLGVPVHWRSWRWALRLARRARSVERSPITKWILEDFIRMLEDLVGHERVFSNLVWVVSLGLVGPTNWKLTWIDVVKKHSKYFFPAGAPRWPQVPPNYIGFRYHGRLQSIHHVENYVVVRDVREHFQGAENGADWGPHFLLDLGPAIVPNHEVRAGPRIRQSNHCSCMLDTLLTCRTISDALTETERRQK